MKPISISALQSCAVRGLCQQEAATVLGVSLATLKNRFNADAELRAIWDAESAAAERRAVAAMGRPTKSERRFFLNLRRDLVERVKKRAAAEGTTSHAFVVRAIEAVLLD